MKMCKEQAQATCLDYPKRCYLCEAYREQTNADRIRAMTDEELARKNVYQTYEYTVDYDMDDNPVGEYTTCWCTSDGAIFWSEESAIEYELNWLQQPCGGADHE